MPHYPEHHIYHLTLINGKLDEMIISSHRFSNLFNRATYKWFDTIARRIYPDAIKRRDNTIAGYHWLSLDGDVLELH